MSATVVYVAYLTPSIDLTWIPQDVETRIVLNGGPRPIVTPGRDVIWIEPGTNLGFGAAVNRAAAGTTTDRLVIVNPDCDLRAEHWGPLTEAGPSHVTTVPLDADGVPSTVASRYPTPLGAIAAALRLRARLRDRVGTSARTAPSGGLAPGASAPLRTHWVSGACLSVDRARFQAVGGFAPTYFLYYEDVDLSARLADRFPEMVASVADVAPGRHAVGASADASGGRATVERARSAAVFAGTRAGPAWRATAALTGWNARRVARQTGLTPAVAAEADVVIVSLGRVQSRGERRRALSWIDIAAVDGRPAQELRLLDECRWCGPLEAARKVLDVLRGRLVPESLAWSTRRTLARLAALQPRTVVVLTSRAYDPRLRLGGARLVLDYVDQLSESYHDRATGPGASRRSRLAWNLLAAAHRRFERSTPGADLAVAAGLADARSLGVEYIPMVSTVAIAQPEASPTHDVAFVGNLRYPPNLEAVRELDAIWDDLLTRRPGTRLLLAGADPDATVTAIAARRGWTLLADFDDERDVYASTRLAVAPLPHASGIQTKVIDALRHAVPVVAYPAAAAGFEESIPLVVALTRAAFVQEVVALLSDDARRVDLGRRSAAWVDAALTPSRWSARL